jgi:phage-related protein
MYLKTDRIVVTIKSTVFRSFRTGTAGQFVLDPTALTGWTDGTNVRRDDTVRPVSSGSFTEPYTFSSRLIALSGTAIANDRSELQTMRDTLTGLIAEGEYTEVAVETSVGTRYATVGLEGSVSWIQQLDNVAIFRIEFYAPDPYIYGVERTINLGSTTSAGGGLIYPLMYPLKYNPVNTDMQDSSVTNSGNVVAWPKFKITGDYYSGFSLSDGRNRKVTYTGVVSRNSPVTIDMEKGTAMQGDSDRTVYLSERQWFSIAPAETIRPEFTPFQAASGYCDIIVRDTFI